MKRRSPFWTRYANVQEHHRVAKVLLTALHGDLEAIARLTNEPTLIEDDFTHLVERFDELALYAHEIQASIERKRVNGIEADARIDQMIGATS